MGSDSTGWPLLEERLPIGRMKERARRRGRPRSPWLLAALAFLCGGLVSAAVFTIGWRHQAQRNTAAESALAAATAHVRALESRKHALETSLAAARRAARRDRQATAAAKAAETAAARAASRAAASLAAEATTASGSADPLSSGAHSLASSAGRIASELKTLTTYLTTTPPRRLDSGYIASQTAYLAQQLNDLQTKGGSLRAAVSLFQTALAKLSADVSALSARQ